MADATCVCSESTSTSFARDARTHRCVFRGPPVNSCHGPAANANRYVGSGSVSRKWYVSPAARRVDPLGDSVGQRVPGRRHGQRERETRFEIGLVEAGKEPVRVRRHEQRVEIVRVVAVVVKADNARPGGRDQRRERRRHLVVAGVDRASRYAKMRAVEFRRRGGAVDADLGQPWPAKVEDDVARAFCRERNGDRSARGVAGDDREIHVVPHAGEIRGAFGRELARDAGAHHRIGRRRSSEGQRGGSRERGVKKSACRHAGRYSAERRRGKAAARSRGASYIPRMTITVELLHDDARAPRRATEGSAGYDLCAYVRARSIKCSDGQRTWTHEPAGTPATSSISHRASRPSSRSASRRACRSASRRRSARAAEPRSRKASPIPNAPGTIDSDFPDEWMVLVKNPTAAPVRIDHGERIAQMVLAKFEVLPIESGRVEVTTDRVGGFGSTGA